jgi:hypothetical protein
MLKRPYLPPFVCRFALLPLLLSLALYYALARGDIASRAPCFPCLSLPADGPAPPPLPLLRALALGSQEPLLLYKEVI